MSWVSECLRSWGFNMSGVSEYVHSWGFNVTGVSERVHSWGFNISGVPKCVHGWGFDVSGSFLFFLLLISCSVLVRSRVVRAANGGHPYFFFCFICLTVDSIDRVPTYLVWFDNICIGEPDGPECWFKDVHPSFILYWNPLASEGS